MNILVCVKQVPDTNEIKIDPETNTLVRDGVPSIVNTFDGYALEAAARVKDNNPDTKIVVLSMGPAQAETALRELGLVAPAETPPAPAEERPVYQRADVAERLEHSKAFQALTRQVEVKLGKKLTTPDVGILLGLTDYLGLPEGVVYLLVCHCVERVQRRFGEGRRPGMKQIEKEGYAWARMGIDTQAAADAYLRTYAQRQGVLPQYMKALQLGDRPPAPSEEKYILAWQEMGFGPEAVALAYDKTVLKCHELKWAYCNGILKKWNEAGLHTVEEIQAGDRPAARRGDQQSPRDTETEMRRYMQELHRNRR